MLKSSRSVRFLSAFLSTARFVFTVIALVSCEISQNSGWTAESSIQKTVINGISFEIADGLQLELAAGNDLIQWPIVADWDNHGRLVVAESGGVTRPVVEHNKLGLHKIVRLIDHDNDGIFDERLVAVENIGFPEGVLCIGNSMLVAIPPEIIKFTDDDGDGVCESRESWFDGKTITGCANDLHGPYFGRDGKIYWCKGAFAEQRHTLADQSQFTSSAAHLYRCNEDGSQLEVVMTGGMDNPVEMAFIPEGEKFFTSTFLQHPNSGLRDGIAHAVYGGVFGKEHRVLEGHIRTGDLMPIMTQLGPAAPSGLIYLENNLLQSTNDVHSRTLCSALFNLHKVTSHTLNLKNATYSTLDKDLLSTEQIDFHPTDIIEDANGSLLVLDTGGWYDLCCPTSRVDQKTAQGGIYRITNPDKQAPSKSIVRFENPLPTDYTNLHLHDTRPWIRREAVRHVKNSGDQITELALREFDNETIPIERKIRNAWAICAAGTPAAIEASTRLLESTNPSLIKVACHSLSLQQYQASRTQLENLLHHPDLSVCRAAAEAIGRLKHLESIEALLDTPHLETADRFVRHSLLFALIEIIKHNPEFNYSTEGLSEPQLAALITVATQLNQVEKISTKVIFTSLSSFHQPLAQSALAAIEKNPWIAETSIDELRSFWNQYKNAKFDRAAIFPILAAAKEKTEIQVLLSDFILQVHQEPIDQQLSLANNLWAISPIEPSEMWKKAVLQWLISSQPEVRLSIAKCLAELKIQEEPRFRKSIEEIAKSEMDIRIKLSLLLARPPSELPLPPVLESDLMRLLSSESRELSELAHRAIRKVHLSKKGGIELASTIEDCEPRELASRIEAIAHSCDANTLVASLKSLENLPAAKTLPRGFLKNAFRKSSPEIQQYVTEVSRNLEKADQNIQQEVVARLKKLPEGDAKRGLQLFRSSRLSCESCHKMGYRGTDIGPDLTRIGGARTSEALLEAILYPNSRIEQGFETHQLLTIDGLSLNGMITSETEKHLHLRVTSDQSITVLKEDIEQIQSSAISIMPNGIAELMTDQEMADLLELLTSAK